MRIGREVKNPFTVEILVNGGKKVLSKYFSGGKTFIQDMDGEEYQIRITNNTERRACCLISVDGLSIYNGQPVKQASTCLIIPTNSPVTIKGWQISQENARKFFFTNNEAESYSAKSGNGANNTGVLGFIFYYEKQFQQPIYRGGIDDGLLTKGMGLSFHGSGMGERVEQNVKKISFNAEDNPCDTQIIYYLSENELNDRGIIVNRFDYEDDPLDKVHAFPWMDQGFCQQFD
jgi:hypothetical protein